MASNFKIFKHQNSSSIHLKLSGDFDGTSAFELMNTLHSCKGHKGKVFIHTSGLRHIHPYGKEVFTKNNSAAKTLHIIYTGEYADDMDGHGETIANQYLEYDKKKMNPSIGHWKS